MNKLASVKELDKLRTQCKAVAAAERKKILVCAGTGCVSGGSLDVYRKFKDIMEERGIPVEVELAEEPHKDVIGLKPCGCLGLCELGPLVRIEPEGWLYTKVGVDDCAEIVEKTIVCGEPVERLAYHQDGEAYLNQHDIPFYTKQTRLVLEHCGHTSATSVRGYLALDGYTALAKALFEMEPSQVVEEVAKSKLRGRGGGGFPAGRKWESVARQTDPVRYVVCNGDEGDPGAFMDQSVMEGDPHRLLEGMIIAGYAVGSHQGYIYVRAEYPRAVSRLKGAIEQAHELGLLGKNILGSGFDFDIRINRGAGAFVCGEGSALTQSIEGKRGMPRVKPPRTAEQGLFGKPTLLNNVETYANVPMIVNRGADWYASIGTPGSPGTKTFCLTGDIAHTGLIEVPMGTTLREVIYDIGGGMRGGSTFKAAQIGGPSGGCLTEKDLDLPLDFDSLKGAGAIIGSGGLVVMDDSTCMVEVARFFMHFTQEESCGKCVPCREGTKRMLEVLERIVAGNGREGDIELLEELADTISNTALCGLGKTAPSPVSSTIANFREEYEAHIIDKRCPAGACEKLMRYMIDPDLCKGCTKCARNCPVDAISGKVKELHVIDQDKCIKCGACMTACSFGAIRKEA